jgi:hypothetical protein
VTESQKGEKKSSFCESHGNRVWEKEKITFSNCFFDYSEEVEEEKDYYGNFHDDDYYFYEQCPYSKNCYSKPTEGWIICSKRHNCTQFPMNVAVHICSQSVSGDFKNTRNFYCYCFLLIVFILKLLIRRV